MPVVDNNSPILIQIFDDENNPELKVSVKIDLESISDKSIDSKWYEIIGKEGIIIREFNIIPQWIHKSINIHAESV